MLPLILARKVKSRSRKGIKTTRERERERARARARGGFEVTTKLCAVVHGRMFHESRGSAFVVATLQDFSHVSDIIVDGFLLAMLDWAGYSLSLSLSLCSLSLALFALSLLLLSLLPGVLNTPNVFHQKSFRRA